MHESGTKHNIPFSVALVNGHVFITSGSHEYFAAETDSSSKTNPKALPSAIFTVM